MSVSPEVETIIKGQIDHLKNTDNYIADRDSPLFQDKKGTDYSEAPRQLRKKFNSPTLEKIRQNGLKEYYLSLNTTAKLQPLAFEQVGPFFYDATCKPLDCAVNGIQ